MKRFLIGCAIAGMIVGAIIGGAKAQQSVVVPATTNQIAVVGTVATITKIVTGISGKSIYVTGGALIPVATSVVTFSYGTGTNCSTGTTVLSGAMTFAAGQTLNLGVGYGTTIVVPPSNDLCITIATAAAPGFLSYSIF